MVTASTKSAGHDFPTEKGSCVNCEKGPQKVAERADSHPKNHEADLSGKFPLRRDIKDIGCDRWHDTFVLRAPSRRECSFLNAGISEINWQVCALCFFSVSNRPAFSNIFGRDFCAPEHLERLKQNTVETILRFVLREVPAPSSYKQNALHQSQMFKRVGYPCLMVQKQTVICRVT